MALFSGSEMCSVSLLFGFLPHDLIKEETKDLCFPISIESYRLEVFGYHFLATDSSGDGLIISKTYFSLSVMVTSREFSQARSVWGR